MAEGRTKPLVLACLRSQPPPYERLLDRSQRRPMLTKAVGLPEVYLASMVREHVGNLVARDFGLTTADPGIVVLGETLATQATAYLRERKVEATVRPGPASGARYVSAGLGPAPMLSAPTAETLRQATLLYAFDMMTGNPDRRIDKHNCGSLNGRLFVFDFETCFTGHLMLGPKPDPWRVRELGFSGTHLFYPMLKRGEPDWSPVGVAVRALTDARLARLLVGLPAEWEAEAKRICGHIASIRDNVDRFVLELGMSAS